MFKKNIYPEAYLKLFIEKIYQESQLGLKMFNKKELDCINTLTTNGMLTYAICVTSQKLEELGWDSNKTSYTFVQAEKIYLKQLNKTENEIEKILDFNSDFILKCFEYVDSQPEGTELAYAIFSFTVTSIVSYLNLDIESKKGWEMRYFVKDNIKRIDTINNKIIKKYNISD